MPIMPIMPDVAVAFFSSTVQGAYKLSEDFATPYSHKYGTEIHDVTTI